ncbi:MAG: extracellular solute-binding protein [Rectinemataceae bacterium]|nr:extracellular solute-binding protein [Rectinemataceae bacterium]
MKKAYIALALALALVAGLSAQTINVLFWDDAYPRTLMERIPEFEKATGIKVNFEILQPPQVFTKTSVSVTKERTDYDLVCVDEGNIPLFASLMLPYDQWAPGKVFKKVDPNTVTPAMLDVAQWDGKLIGLPINGNLYVWMTRKDLVENPKYKADFKAQYGYELTVPQTFQQLLDSGSFFQKNGIVSGGFGPFQRRTGRRIRRSDLHVRVLWHQVHRVEGWKARPRGGQGQSHPGHGSVQETDGDFP